jgi:hypothetical protein
VREIDRVNSDAQRLQQRPLQLSETIGRGTRSM